MRDGATPDTATRDADTRSARGRSARNGARAGGARAADPLDVNQRIAARVRELRSARGLALEALAQESGVSRSMISLIERGESSATAVVLEKLAASLGVSLAGLFEDPQVPASPLARRKAQPQWRDPASGYLRRNLSPPGVVAPLQLVEVEFPPGARIAYETGVREQPLHEQVWVLEGRIELRVGEERYRLEAGDCLAMQLDRPTAFYNPGRKPARYLVAIARDAPALRRRP
jgi:transcriptional regulator with XRE-family HTH domain